MGEKGKTINKQSLGNIMEVYTSALRVQRRDIYLRLSCRPRKGLLGTGDP